MFYKYLFRMEERTGNLPRSRCTIGMSRLKNSTVVQDFTVEMIFSEKIAREKMELYHVIVGQGKMLVTVYARALLGVRELLKNKIGEFLCNLPLKRYFY